MVILLLAQVACSVMTLLVAKKVPTKSRKAKQLTNSYKWVCATVKCTDSTHGVVTYSLLPSSIYGQRVWADVLHGFLRLSDVAEGIIHEAQINRTTTNFVLSLNNVNSNGFRSTKLMRQRLKKICIFQRSKETRRKLL